MKMKDLALAQVRRGERFTLDGVEFVKLEDDMDAAFAVAADTLPECCQFEDDDAEREDHNNYAGSLLSKTVERWLRDKHPAIFSAVVERPIDPMEASKVALAKMVWGEARGCSTTEQAATIWCVLNRYDSGDRFWADTVEGITTQPCQFYGYDPSNPVDPDILALVEDVLARWMAEKECVGSVGRVLPKEYLYFTGDGAHNYFTTEWQGGQTWDWSLESPYEG